jgi:hypothetical protein
MPARFSFVHQGKMVYSVGISITHTLYERNTT